MNQKITKISASKLKTFSNCSWFFWCNYHLKLVQDSSIPLELGSFVHLILELLFTPKHRHYLKKINNSQNIFTIKPFYLLARKHLSKTNLFNDERLQEINSWALVALNNDFLCKGALKTQGEYEFSIPHGKLAINGFIDKIAIYKDKVVIYDYKSNKKKFSGEDKESNTQALIYLWVARHLFPGKKKYILRFLFLRFPNDPIQEHEYDETQIDGFKYYVTEAGNQIADFDETQASSNLASVSSGKRWLCRAGKTWVCPYLKPFKYFALVNKKTQEIIKTSLDKKKLPKNKDHVIIEKEYEGCIHFRHEFAPQNDKDNDWTLF